MLSFLGCLLSSLIGARGFAAPPPPRQTEPASAERVQRPAAYRVMPKGWLLEQLRLQAKGLSGHLDEFWPDLGPESAWLGGNGEGWERGPYFLDGLVPLAYLTGDRACSPR